MGQKAKHKGNSKCMSLLKSETFWVGEESQLSFSGSISQPQNLSELTVASGSGCVIRYRVSLWNSDVQVSSLAFKDGTGEGVFTESVKVEWSPKCGSYSYWNGVLIIRRGSLGKERYQGCTCTKEGLWEGTASRTDAPGETRPTAASFSDFRAPQVWKHRFPFLKSFTLWYFVVVALHNGHRFRVRVLQQSKE